ncbi:MAG TPA: hypothetical protein VFA42_00950 [Gaiellaceae bacterium]|nr:hypothetical protein [Gaiellaceae bacterium]
MAALVVAFTPGIRTPSGNISCFVSHRTLHCAIVQAAYRPRLRQLCAEHTTVDWHGFELSPTERGTPTCSGGILYESPPRYHTLAYGLVWRIGGITCTSRITGLTCTAGAHGLFISRASWRGW